MGSKQPTPPPVKKDDVESPPPLPKIGETIADYLKRTKPVVKVE